MSDNQLDRIVRGVRVVKWMMAANLALTLALLIITLGH